MEPMAGLCCVNCLAPDPAAGDREIRCAACGARFPVRGGVPVMFRRARPVRGARLDRDSARAVARAFGLADDPLGIEALRQTFTEQAHYGDPLIETEAAHFLNRVRDTGHEVSVAAPGAPVAAAPRGTATAIRWLRDNLPRRFAPGARVTADMRFENAGDTVWRCAGADRCTLASTWERMDGTAVAANDARTPLPLDVPPGRALTLPLLVAPPNLPGDYLLRLRLVQEGVRWHDESALSVLVSVQPGAAAEALPPNWTAGSANADYESDHRVAAGMLRAWLDARTGSRRGGGQRGGTRVLEVGGNACPSIAELPGELYNVDVDLMGLQTGAMLSARRRRTIRHLCADAQALPFVDGHFDAISMFASLHHFPEPDRVLGHLRDKLAPDGFIALMCEPVGHIWPGAVDPGFLAELRCGVNEQSFRPGEYETFFRAARLRTEEAVVHGSSLKARLVRIDAR